MNKVKYYRLISGLLLKDLSEKTGLSVGHLSHIENGNKQPSKSAMESIALAVGSTVRYDALLGFQYGYINLQETIRRTSALVVKLDQAVGLSFMLDEAEKDTQVLEALERAYKRFKDASEEERVLRYKVSSLGNTEALADILESISKQYDELDNLKKLNAVSQSRQLSFEAAGRYLEKCNGELEKAQEELQAAWEAAGGVCPLCGSEVKENCTH